MSTQITITLPDIASLLADTIQQSIPPVKPDTADLEPIANLSDEEVLTLTELQLEPDQDTRFSELLDQQQAGTLSNDQRIELQTLLQIYQEGLLRKATALSEAVKRGLISPINP